jgi:hypothetical protein
MECAKPPVGNAESANCHKTHSLAWVDEIVRDPETLNLCSALGAAKL